MLYHYHWIYRNILAKTKKVSPETRHAHRKLDIYIFIRIL